MTKTVYGLEVGSSIGGYRIDRLVGEGGMGAVYVATHIRLGRRAALKVMLPRLVQDGEFRERFIRESRLAASIEHPNIIPIYDADEDDGVLYLAMRYVDGVDLAKMLDQRGRLSLEEALAVVAPIASALDAAHAAGLVHRDVKPANVLIENGTRHVFLTDFGLAKTSASTGFTRTGSFVGTPHYCSPEQINGKPVDGRADVYSLGCLFFHCLTGQPPFPRDSEVAVIHAHLTAPPPAVTTIRPDLPRFLDGVVGTAMAKFPEVRYTSGEELIASARAGAATVRPTPTTWTPPVRTPRPTLAEPQPRGTEHSAQTQATIRVRFRRKRGMVAALVGVLLVAAVGAVVLIVNPGSGTGGHASAKPPPSRTVPQLIAARLNSELVPRQRKLTDDVRSLQASSSSLQAMETDARQLHESVLESQGWAGGALIARTTADTAAKQLFERALTAQASYAKHMETLPATPSRFTTGLASEAVSLADRTEEAYARLSGAAAGLPEMPVHRTDHVHLLSVATRPRVPSRPTTVTVTGTIPGSSTPSPSGPTSTPSSQSLQLFSGNYFTISYPSSWAVETAEVWKTSYFDTTIRDPQNSKRLVRVDVGPGAPPDLDANARPVVTALQRQAGYQQLAYDRITFNGHPALQWEFLVREDGLLLHKVDIFLIDSDGNGFGILTEAPAEQWIIWRPVFERVLGSLLLRAG